MTASLADHSSERQLTTSATDSITTGDSDKKGLGDIIYTNTSAAAVEVTVWRLHLATTATEGVGGNWLDKRTITAGRTWSINPGKVLDFNMKWQAKSDTGAVINENISGVTEV